MKKISSIFMLLLVILFILSEAVFAGDKKCLICHNDPKIKDEDGNSIQINLESFTASIHSKVGLECVSCHADLADMKNPSHTQKPKKVECQNCHGDIWKDYSLCVHGKSSIGGDKYAATCVDCHGSHEVKEVKDPTAPTYPTNIPQLCLKCHLNEEIVKSHDMGRIEKVKAYLDSVHYKALKEKGLTISATCVDCHGVHNIKRINQIRNMEDKKELLRTCAKCHEGIYNSYIKSVHGKAFNSSNKDVPVCTDCHGEHTIKSHLEPEASTYATRIGETCSKCHDNVAINSKYGLPLSRMKSYMGTYHGVATALGDITVANCASCHGYHDILPSSDPESSINQKNIGKTCEKCHPGAGKTFITLKIHVEKPKEMHIVPKTIKLIYELLIAGVIGGFIFYIILDLFGNYRRRRSDKMEKHETL